MSNFRKERPSIRVKAAMKRLSKNRWISGHDVMRIGVALARCACPWAYGTVLKHAIRDECYVVGMILGDPPLASFEDGYRQLLKSVHKKKHDGLSAEIAILNTFLKVKK